ncbi:MAG: adenosylcobinamide-phosphate synthase CbiB [Coriobacteriales bacterium]|jgi:adenosylcobinamide-phosphate synthase
MPVHLLALIFGFLLDLIFGDPEWLPHPIRAIGKMISGLEDPLRHVFPATARGEFWAGFTLSVIAVSVVTALAVVILWLCSLVSVWLVLIVESIMCYQLLATKALHDESNKVRKALEEGDLDKARHAVSMIVGRDTNELDEEEVAKAAVETVAENTGDGVVAPMFFMAIGGAPLGFFYKTVNTLDSMIGYKNDRYINFGTFGAKFDDVLNFIPSRLAGVLMAWSARFVGLDSKNAMRIFLRDRLNHLSPNSAQTEAACAGALHVQLGGPHLYGGKMVDKPYIGDPDRKVVAEDIRTSNNLMYATATVSLCVCMAISAIIFWLTGF